MQILHIELYFTVTTLYLLNHIILFFHKKPATASNRQNWLTLRKLQKETPTQNLSQKPACGLDFPIKSLPACHIQEYRRKLLTTYKERHWLLKNTYCAV